MTSTPEIKNGSIVIDYEQPSYRKETEEFFHKLPGYTKDYVVGLFPIASWIHRYNLHWLVQDLIAGLTVGVVIVPQSMGYAKIAQLPPQYGLYTAFVGLCVYCLFATSKDISIGPTAVMSLLVGNCVLKAAVSHPEVTAPQIAAGLSLVTGAIAMAMGLVRLGILVDFIPGPAIAGFMTGSAITICVGQWPKLFGIKGINTQDSPYLIFGNFFKNLPKTKLDVAFGLTGLLWLYGVRYLCQVLGKKYPKYSNHLFFFSILRNGILVIFGTLIAFLINIGKDQSPISILLTVPSGFQAMGVPHLSGDLMSAISGTIPSGVIILVLEHVAIAKSFGRINDYAINPNQEVIAIGFTNIWAAFFGAYPSTGSFSRTAIKARSGVKTPIAGIFSALVVILALYALTPAFYYIPDATLAAIVIHAVSDLVSGPAYIKKLAKVSLWELLVFAAGVIITVFTNVENGIYASLGLSIAILLVRIARPRFFALGRIALSQPSATPTINDNDDSKAPNETVQNYLYVPKNHPTLGKLVESLPDGIIMVRVDESFTYPNSGFISDKVIQYCKEHTRRFATALTKGERAWNDDANPTTDAARAKLPLIHAVIFDFSSVNRLDSSGLQAIVDIQNALNRYAGRHVEFHFINISHPAIRRALIVGGFGSQPRLGVDNETQSANEILPIVPASQDGPLHRQNTDHSSKQEDIENHRDTHFASLNEKKSDGDNYTDDDSSYSSPSIGLPRDRYPFFHWSADEAVRSAVATLVYRSNESTPEFQNNNSTPEH